MKKKNLRQILIPAFIITACIPITIFTVDVYKRQALAYKLEYK